MSEYSFVKGHGTENDFVLVPDANGTHDLSPEQVTRLCDRRAGIGADGVIRVVRTDATEDPAAVAARGEATWFMDYRNADGSLSEMCGNGIRVLGLFLATHADVDPRDPLPIATRAGTRTLSFDGEQITVDMGQPQVVGETSVTVAGRATTPATSAWATRTPSRSSRTSTPSARCWRRRATTPRPTPTASTSSSSYAAASTTSRCGCTSAARGRPAPAAPARAP